MSTRIAINGLGRIGRCVVRALAQRDTELELVAINDVADAAGLAMLLRYDSVYGRFPAEVSLDEGTLVAGPLRPTVLSEADPSALPWSSMGVDVVLDCSGRFRTRDQAAAHLTAGARKVIVSAPVKGPDVTLCLGVNEAAYDPERHDVISNASCTTNCLAPVAKVLLERFGVDHGFITTCHAYTSDQQLLDAPHKDPRRARAAALSIIPTSTGAARATGEVLPELKGRMDGIALRVPVPDGSVVDLTCQLSRETTADEVNAALRGAAESGPLTGILGYTEDPIVSTDVIGDDRSSLVDGSLTMVSGTTAKVISWYDNEWAYACRLVELAARVGAALPVAAAR
jgi:glyceraldehyde 3-phosphate dehydrogenase